jgi:predicted nucleotidyltransferase
MEQPVLHGRIKTALRDAFGARFRSAILYGSEARAQSRPDSDLDVLVLLDGPVQEPRDSWTCIDAVYPLVLEIGRPIHVEPVAATDYEAGQFPLYRSVQHEGVAL